MDSDLKPRRFSVLFYRRSNKVHKNRGTTREDGILSIAPPPSCMVCLTSGSTTSGDVREDEGESEEEIEYNKVKKRKWKDIKKNMASGNRHKKSGVVWSGPNSTLSKKAFASEHGENGWEEDNIIVLSSQWECQIVDMLDKVITKKGGEAAKKAVPTPLIRKRPASALLSRMLQQPRARPKLMLSNKPRKNGCIGTKLYPIRSNGRIKTCSGHVTATLPSAKTIRSQRNLPHVPSSAKMKKDNDAEMSEESSDEFDAPAAPLPRSKVPPSLIRSSALKLRCCSPARPSISKNPSDNEMKNGPNEYFPGALGSKINLPASVRRSLRPHQREGITFLWNCVTGASPNLNRVASRSLSNDYASDSISPGNHSTEIIVPKGAILADEMGLGKVRKWYFLNRFCRPPYIVSFTQRLFGASQTLMTIAIIFALHRHQRDRRFVVVCPSSLVSNWAKEFDKWLGKASQPRRVVVRNGGEDGLRRLRSFVPPKPQQSEVLILSYELLRLHSKILSKSKLIRLLVVDEGHRLKNTAGSQTLSALNSINSEARILITGTPIQNNLSEFYNVANFAVPGILGDLSTFRNLYERPLSLASQKNASQAQKEIGRQQSKALDTITSAFVLRRLQKDVLKFLLPPRTELLMFCLPTDQQRMIYNNISSRVSNLIPPHRTDDGWSNPLMLLTEVRKLCTHPFLLEGDNDSQSIEHTRSGKLIILCDLLDSIRRHHPTDKVVIVSNFTTALDVIEESILRKKGLPFVRLDGSTNISARQPLVDSFNNGSIGHSFAFLLSSKAGGCGLNLIGANRLVMLDADWNPATDQQAMARIYRQGQKKKCYIYRMFTTGTVEEVILQRQIQKGNIAKLASDGGSHIKRKGGKSESFSAEELRDCFALKEGCRCDTKSKLGSKWVDFAGPLSLVSQGCTDEPILQVCTEQPEILSFVHIADDGLFQNDGESALSDDESTQSSTDNEISNLKESSSEEEEFDG